MKLRAVLVLMVLSLLACRAWADPPARVGRIGTVVGNVALRNLDTGATVDAQTNWPVTAHTEVATAPGARVEVDIGGLAVRLDGDTDIAFDQLDDAQVQIELDHGAVSVRVNDQSQAQGFEMDLPQGAVTLLNAGSYRFDAGLTPQSQEASNVTTFQGTANFVSEGTSFAIPEGRTAQIFGEDTVSYVIAAARSDEFDAWALAQDQRETALTSLKYVSPAMTGYEELDQYGTWQQTPDDGPMWVPADVPEDWAPYRDGQWTWTEPWGWTWVAVAPWGFAPSHYGRWCYTHGHWGWLPGRYTAHPVYGPAIVGWIHSNPGLRSAVLGLPIGWFPLGPHEAYTPPYAASPSYVRSINMSHVFAPPGTSGSQEALSKSATGVTASSGTAVVAPGGTGAIASVGTGAIASAGTGAIASSGVAAPRYRYALMPQAVTMAPAGALTAGRPIAHQRVVPDAEALATAQVTSSAPKLRPPLRTNARGQVAFAISSRDAAQVSAKPVVPPASTPASTPAAAPPQLGAGPRARMEPRVNEASTAPARPSMRLTWPPTRQARPPQAQAFSSTPQATPQAMPPPGPAAEFPPPPMAGSPPPIPSPRPPMSSPPHYGWTLPPGAVAASPGGPHNMPHPHPATPQGGPPPGAVQGHAQGGEGHSAR